MGSIRVFLADDHPIFREGLKGLLAAAPGFEVVGEAADGVAACDGVRELAPDVAVLDVSLPRLNGIRVAERLRADCPAVRVLALTVHEDTSYLRQLLAAGARGYVLKRSAPNGFVHAVTVVAGGGVYLDPVLAARLVSGMTGGPTAASALAEVGLSDREEDVVRRTASGYGNKEIAAQLGLSVKTIETYRARVMEKLGLRCRADLVRYALHRGWLE
ncbi:MAG TPA: response regulator transcription factor [Urbifossiella sp.]|nr:response regulator transcription factor [Urbifossiella sp.]